MVRSKYSTSLFWYSKTNMELQCLREQFASDVKNICFIVSWKANVSPNWTRNHLLYRMYICTPIIVLYGKCNKHMLSTSKQDLIHLDSFFPQLNNFRVSWVNDILMNDIGIDFPGFRNETKWLKVEVEEENFPCGWCFALE